MPDIVLTTLNARFTHASFGLRYLRANLLASLFERSALLEFDISQRSVDIVEKILAANPRIVGIGVYIWNAVESLKLVSDLKRVRPGLLIVLGGPEVSYETDAQRICSLADYVIAGEADHAFGELCGKLLAGERPPERIISAELPHFEVAKAPLLPIASEATPAKPVALPYELYTDADLAHRVVYVEASRGCPFRCEFCLSSLDIPVRNVPLDAFLIAMGRLLDRGVRSLKFVDRTFNLNLNFSRSILQFFLDRWTPGMFLHFEMIPDRLPDSLRSLIEQFPPGALQFEVGVQTLNPDVAGRISRRQDVEKLRENLLWLRESTGVHVHADLIVGLPGEDIESFGAGFDQLLAMRPQEIQVGMLKRLRGTPIVRHDEEHGMIYSESPPYEILATNAIDFASMQRMRRFSRYWDLVANSGNFIETATLLTSGDVALTKDDERRIGTAPFAFCAFLKFSDWLYATTGQTHGISLTHLAKLLFDFLTGEGSMLPQRVASSLAADFDRVGRSDRPAFMRELVPAADTRRLRQSTGVAAARQARHLGV